MKLATKFESTQFKKEKEAKRQKEFISRQTKFLNDKFEKHQKSLEEVKTKFSFNPKLNDKSKKMMDKSPSRNIELIKQ